MRCFVGCLFLLFAVSCIGQGKDQSMLSFQDWLNQVKIEAASKGISQDIVDRAFDGLQQPKEQIIFLDQNQPESKKTVSDYISKRVFPNILKGKKKLKSVKEVLIPISKKYQVQPEYIMALWGIETNYGKLTGKFPVIHALATLAFDNRRAAFFREELFHALKILNEGHISLEKMKGSWAGAMGQTQFMPSSFWRHAVDEDQDGKADIWESVTDVLASIANYLHDSGWQESKPWGYAVCLPKDFDKKLASLDIKKSVARWSKLKVTLLNGKNLPVTNSLASIIILDQDKAGASPKAFLIFDNFRVILKWNKSSVFAVAVGMLADQLEEENNAV